MKSYCSSYCSSLLFRAQRLFFGEVSAMSGEICESKHIHEDIVRRAAAVLPPPQVLEEVVVIFEVLSEPSRVLILLAILKERELCVCDVAALLDVSVASASHHLRKMKDVGILKKRSEGKLVFYSVKNHRIESVLKAGFGEKYV